MTLSNALLASKKQANTLDPLEIYLEATFLSSPVQRSVDRPLLKPNCSSDVVKNSPKVINRHHSKSLLRFEAREMGL